VWGSGCRTEGLGVVVLLQAEARNLYVPQNVQISLGLLWTSDRPVAETAT